MNRNARERFNSSFSQQKYQALLYDVQQEFGHTPAFRIAESPIFVGQNLKEKIFKACEDLNKVVTANDFKEKTEGALKDSYRVPDETSHSLFLQYDFGITEDENGELSPQLIEAQGFPTLYFYQDLIAKKYQKHFDVDPAFSHLFGGLDSEGYIELLRKVIVGDANPKNVILLEIEPNGQVTQIDYWATQKALGIKVLCISDLKSEGKDLYYLDENGKKIEVHRIYNRVIFDELIGRNDIERTFSFKQEINAEWVGHPNWYFRLSKYALPLFDSEYVPKTMFLSDISEIPDDLENYVLKPLYSFSGSGVIFNVLPEHLESIEDKSQYILQKKVNYIPVVQSPNGKVKCEIRILSIWPDINKPPMVVNNLSRLSRGDLIGVKYNLNKDWVGGSVSFFEK